MTQGTWVRFYASDKSWAGKHNDPRLTALPKRLLASFSYRSEGTNYCESSGAVWFDRLMSTVPQEGWELGELPEDFPWGGNVDTPKVYVKGVLVLTQSREVLVKVSW